MLVTVVSAKGSPGATTLALGLAAGWPQRAAALVEADGAGGDLVTRFGLHHVPGLATMALVARDLTRPPRPDQWVQALPCGVEAVLAPPGPAAAASLSTLNVRGGQLLRLLAVGRSAVVVDVGRWRPGSPADPLLAASDVVLVVIRPVPEEIRQLAERLPGLRERVAEVRLVLVGERGPWPPREIATGLGVPLAATLPIDRAGAAVLAGRAMPRRGWRSTGWRRLPLLRACHSLARHLVANVHPGTGVLPAPPIPSVPPQPGQLPAGVPPQPAGAPPTPADVPPRANGRTVVGR